MVCARCQKTLKKTSLATSEVKRKNELYHGSPASTSSTNAGVSKNKLLSKAAKNPYAAYSSSCETCKTKCDQGRKFCLKCAYKANKCAMCGKKLGGDSDGAKQSHGGAAEVVVDGRRFSAK